MLILLIFALQDPETAALIRKLDDKKREAVQRKQCAKIYKFKLFYKKANAMENPEFVIKPLH